MKQSQTRIAPTPSGFLHLGNVFAFLIAAVEAKKRGLTLRLRIDDLDRTRFRLAYLADVFAVLEVLGITWQHGPQNSVVFLAEYSQALRLPLYENYLARLQATGLVYACACSRAEILAHGHDSAACKAQKHPLNVPRYAWRLQLERGRELRMLDFQGQPQLFTLGEDVMDPIVKRKQERGVPALPAYHLACVADDVHFGTTQVVRGQDLFESSLLQLYIAELLHETRFLEMQFLHHPLITNLKGEKLSKSAGANKGNSLLVTHPTQKQLYAALGAILGEEMQAFTDFEAWWSSQTWSNCDNSVRLIISASMPSSS